MGEEWEKTRDIDNPLSPWVAKYQGELNLDDVENFHDRPPLDIVIRKFRAAKITSYIAAVCFTILFVVIWPAFIVLVPLIQEIMAVLKQLERNKEDKTSMSDEHVPLSKLEMSQDSGMPNPSFTAAATQQNRSKSNYIYQRFINLLSRNLRISRN